MQTNHKSTCGCGVYLHGDFCGVQEKNKRYLKNVDLMNHMWQKYAANIGKTKLTYKPPIDTEDEELDSKEEEEMNDQPRHIFCLNIRSISPYPVRTKQLTSYVVEKKKSITVNKERNKRRKGSSAVSIFKRTHCAIIGVYASNDFELARTFSPSYRGLEENKRGVFGGFICDILIEDVLFGDAHSR